MSAPAVRLATFAERGTRASIAALTTDFAAPHPAPAPCDRYADGYAAGRAAAHEELADAHKALITAAEDVRREQHRLTRTFQDETALSIASLISAAAPSIALAAALGELRVLIENAASPAPQGAVELRAHPAFLADIKGRLGSGAGECAIAFIDDETIAKGDLRATWPGGGLSLDVATTTKAIVDFLDRKIACGLFEGLTS